MKFKNKAHENVFYYFLSQMKETDSYHAAVAYLLSLNETLTNNAVKVFDIFEKGIRNYLSNTYKECRAYWYAALKLLEEINQSNLSEIELENLTEIQERLFRIFRITSEMFNDYFKITESDKWVVEFDPILKFNK